MGIPIMKSHHEILNYAEGNKHPKYPRLSKGREHADDYQDTPDNFQHRKQIPNIGCEGIWKKPEWRQGDQEKRRISVIHHPAEREVGRIQIAASADQRAAGGVIHGKVDQIADE